MSTKNKAVQKFSFGAAPKDFKKTISIIDVLGGETTIDFTFIYRTKKQFAELADEGIAKAKAAQKAAESEKGDGETPDNFFSDLYAKNDEFHANYVLKIASGWELPDDFTKSNLLRLENDNAGALVAISRAYAGAIAEARVKN